VPAAGFTPDWPTCGRDPSCIGIRVDDHDGCFAHLSSQERYDSLGRLRSSPTDLRGTRIDRRLLDELFLGSQFGGPVKEIDAVLFERATFVEPAMFEGVRFRKAADFSNATFEGAVSFEQATFSAGARFDGTVFLNGFSANRTSFGGYAVFDNAKLHRKAWFDGAAFATSATFQGALLENGRFDQTRFGGETIFNGTTFLGRAYFDRASFEDEVWFRHADSDEELTFNGATFAMPALFWVRANTIRLDDAQFARAVDLEIRARRLLCRGTRFAAGVTLRATYATIDASRVEFGAASSIAGVDRFDLPGERPRWLGDLEEERVDWHAPFDKVVLDSLRYTDVSNLVLTNVYLGACLFDGAHRLDQLRIEGSCDFASPGPWRTGRRACRGGPVALSGHGTTDPAEGPAGAGRRALPCPAEIL
jgi:uncharacterized protein YjbI with pentapeptide repeats